ncbi:membrane receptor RagA [Prevotella veroralis]|uniref:membrane receptor RagA n=1 Tax=Prevotella veroralis TaxID=28137 RepID=UPI0003A7796D|nr:membrane receptor RagA [Prevotella veroralis]
MTKGKDICKALKGIRQQIADANNIRYQPCECHHEGDCSGTCPACEQEIRYLEEQLKIRKRRGWSMKVAGLAAGFCVATIPLVSCSNTPKSTFAKAIESPQKGEALPKVENFSTDKEHSVVISGLVVDGESNKPISSIEVFTRSGKKSLTFTDGRFAVRVNPTDTLLITDTSDNYAGFHLSVKEVKSPNKELLIRLWRTNLEMGKIKIDDNVKQRVEYNRPQSHKEKCNLK